MVFKIEEVLADRPIFLAMLKFSLANFQLSA